MSLTAKEAAEIKATVNALEKSHDQTIVAIKENTQAVQELVVEMKERDVRDEFLKAEVQSVKAEQKQFEEFSRPILVRSKRWQDFTDKIYGSMGGGIGKFILAIIGLGFLAMIGVDIAGLVK